MPYTLKQKLGALALDVPRFAWWLGRSWVRIRNRNETIALGPAGKGAACLWRWTSDLHVAKVYPSLGGHLMRHAMTDWPIEFADAPSASRTGGEVQVSFIVGHRGTNRVPHLLATLQTIAAQRDVRVECIVVEQSAHSEVRCLLPGWVRYVHTPVPVPDMPYARSWAFNVGARLARGELLVFHDNDMLVPAAYARELCERFNAGHQVINLKRFIFYLSPEDSARVGAGDSLGAVVAPEAVMQNAEAGGSVAVARDAFFALGGYDESFVGWGGEDNEFWERAQTLRVWPWAWLPLVHLWHPAQPGKRDSTYHTADLYRKLAQIDPKERIRRLNAIDQGRAEGPAGWPNGSHAHPSG